MRHIEPEKTIPATRCTASPSAVRAQCTTCEKTYCSIITMDRPRYEHAYMTFVIKRGFYCDHCDHWRTWHQAVDIDGAAVGLPIDKPVTISRAKDVNWLLEQYPEATGVEA